MAYTTRLDARVVNHGSGDVSGDFTSGTFTAVAGSLLVAMVAIDNQNGPIEVEHVPTPTTTGTTWNLVEYSEAFLRNFSCSVWIFMADSPGAGSTHTFAMSGGAANWDNNVNAVDLIIVEFPDALAYSSQNGGTAANHNDSDGARDPGAISLTLDATPAESSYVLGVWAGDTDTSSAAVTPGTGWTELHDRTAVSGGPYLSSQSQIRLPGSTSTTVSWADVNVGGTSYTYDHRWAAVEVKHPSIPVTHVATTSDSAINAPTPSTPAGTTGDIIIAAATGYAIDDTDPTPYMGNATTKAAFSTVVSQLVVGSFSAWTAQEVRTRVTDGTEASSYNLDMPQAAGDYVHWGALCRITAGQLQTTNGGVYTNLAGAGNAELDIPAHTVDTDGSLVVIIACGFDNNITNTAFTAQGYTSQANFDSSFGRLYTKEVNAGSVGVVSNIQGGSDDAGVLTLLIFEPFDAGGPASVTGSGAPTLSAVTSVGVGDYTPPPVTGSGSPTLSNVTSVGAGTYTPTLVIEQEGFRFRTDTGNEATPTWEAAQDANVTMPAGVTKGLRVLINYTGDPPTGVPKLQYRRVGDADWIDVT